MRFENSETPTFDGSSGRSDGSPSVAERMNLKDRDGSVIAYFDKAVDGTISLYLNGVQVAADTDVGSIITAWTAASASSAASLAFAEDTDNGANTVTVIAPASVASNATVTLPGVTSTVATLAGTETLTNKTLTSPVVNGGAALGATSTEIDQLNDVSAYQESVVAAGALSVTKVYSGLAVVSGGAVTLAAPSATMLGQLKTIEMTTDDGDVTLALTNVVGGSAATTATFNDVRDTLVLLAAADKWVVIKESGVALT